jgi:hypothetical protein
MSDQPTFFESDMAGLEEELAFLDERQSRGEIPRMDLKNGQNRVRVLPAYSESGRWAKRYGMHWKLPVEGDQTTFRCAREDDTSPGECMFCEAAEYLAETQSREVANRWRSKLRFDFNVIDLNSPEDGVKVMAVGPSIAKSIFRSAEMHGDPTHPENGYAFTITKTKTGTNAWDVDYDVQSDHNHTPLEDWSVLDSLFNLDEIYPAPGLTEQRKALGIEAGDDKPALLEPAPVQEEEEVAEEPTNPESMTPGELLRQRLEGVAG